MYLTAAARQWLGNKKSPQAAKARGLFSLRLTYMFG